MGMGEAMQGALVMMVTPTLCKSAFLFPLKERGGHRSLDELSADTSQLRHFRLPLSAV
jgi:hypothetical protein